MWMTVTVAAAIFQTWRTAMQQRLRSLLSVSGAGFVRYVWGAPIAFAAVAAMAAAGQRLPSPPSRFWPLIAAGGIAQIVATILLISAFDARGFAVGTVYSKTEVVQVAVFSAVLLDEALRPLGWAATVLCFAGVVVLAGGRAVLRHLDRAAVLGLFAGTGFGLAAVSIRAASQSLGDSPPLVRAIVALAVRLHPTDPWSWEAFLELARRTQNAEGIEQGRARKHTHCSSEFYVTRPVNR